MQELLHCQNVCQQISAGIRGLQTGSVTVGTAYSASYAWISEAASDFHSQYPGIELQIRGGYSTQLLEALRASGASWWQVVFQGVVPEKVNEMLSWTFIRFEINFVNAVAVGAVAGAGGIGYQLFLAGSFYYNIHEVGLIVYLCLAVAVVLEVAATQLRKRYIVQH